MKSVLMVTDWLDTLSGGAEKQIYLLARGLVQDGWLVDILVLQSDCNVVNIFKNLGIDVYVAALKRVYGVGGLILARKWKTRFKDRSYDAVLSYHFGADLWVSSFLRSCNFEGKFISMRRDDGFWMRFYHNKIYSWFINPKMDFVCCVSNVVRNHIIKSQHISDEKVITIYNGIEDSRFYLSPYRARDRFNITYVANLSPIKNHIMLIKAVALLRPFIDLEAVTVRIVGRDKGMLTRLKRLVRDYKLENIVKFLGERQDIPQILEDTDLCVQLSFSEGMSNTLLEYMAAGRPIIASAIDPNIEVLGDCGLYVDPYDLDSFVRQILKLYKDLDKREYLADRARERVKKNFSVSAMLEKYKQLLS